ncbi:hypothetical protein KK141_17365 [Dyella sp. LX-66]|uniref:hypothetical protein n=1 Tax=unclassified Dyella TaxID=2634549 RepID=UPI001BE122A8|nr:MULTISPECIES: hypothetical protein [unclassified Dyella]MBT2117804.1 hypothetical protein [Dyella sp. LX-1]MBT2141319.1 hypothetical protein [Dyella sp. LX-66]
MNIPLLSSMLGWLLSRRREQALDTREATKALALELERLAELMDDVLQATDVDGSIVQTRIFDLEFRRRRIWNRWCAIMDAPAYAGRDPQIRAEIASCVQIAHAAPGAYIKEIDLVQVALAEARVSSEVKVRFADAIERLRNLVVKLRLSV